jgi:hypothetical protein
MRNTKIDIKPLADIFTKEFSEELIKDTNRNLYQRFMLEIEDEFSLTMRRKRDAGSVDVLEKVLLSDVACTALRRLLKKKNIPFKLSSESKSDIYINDIEAEIKTKFIDIPKNGRTLSGKQLMFQGSTHGKKKCNTYIFMNFLMNPDVVMKDKKHGNKDFIVGFGLFIVTDGNVKSVYWHGTESDKNSRSTLKFPVKKINDIIIPSYGKVAGRKKYCSFIPEMIGK